MTDRDNLSDINDLSVLHNTDDVVRHDSKYVPNDVRHLEAGAKAANDFEVNDTTWGAIKANKKAIGWSLLISTAVIMEGNYMPESMT